MAVYKDKNGTWYVSARYTNWKGEADRKVKRGFQTKREAAEWEKNFFLENAGNLDMTFEAFYQLYKQNTKDRIKLNTWKMKESVIEGKILPYFRSKRMNEIKPRDVVNWQNTMMKMTDDNGKPFSPVYLKTIHNQLSAIFNHAVKFYDLPSNPAQKAGNMGKEKSREMLFWTQAEYQQFAEAMMSKPISFYAFEVLYWAGLRLGELLALTKKDIDFRRGIIRINKSYQRIDGEDVITEPKTPNSVRNIQMPEFLAEELKDYIDSLYGIDDDDRIFPISKSYLHHEMERGCKTTGVKKIRIHDIRHSHEELNTKLYEKLFAEQEDFKGWLLKQPPEEILKHAYEYVIREDIVIEMEFHDLIDDEARALLADEKPLQSIYNIYEDLEGGHMDEIRDCIESRAKTCIEEQREALRNLPVYVFSVTFAKEHGELEAYRASFRANVDCKNAIEESISNHYSDNRLDGSCVQEVVDRFGAERVSFVLANTIQHKDWDGRISPQNKEWAKAELVPNDFDAWGGKKTIEYSCNQAHPGLINLFVNRFRKEQELAAEKKPSVLQKLKEAKVDTPTKAPTKKKEVEL